MFFYSGLQQVGIPVQFFDLVTFTFSIIFCNGLEFLQSPNTISVNKNNGSTVVFLTLNPSSPSCAADIGVPTTTLNLSRQFNGAFHELFSGVREFDGQGSTDTANFRNESWNLTLNGSVGPVSGPFSGSSQVGRSFEWIKQK